MQGIYVDHKTLLDVPRDMDALLELIERQRITLESTRKDRSLGEKELADHGRALNKLSASLLLCGTQEARQESLELNSEAIAIWTELGRARALHLAEIRRVDVLDALEEYDEAHVLLQRLIREQHENPDTLQRPYYTSLLTTHARVLARQQKHREASEAIDKLIQTLKKQTKNQSSPIIKHVVELQEAIAQHQ